MSRPLLMAILALAIYILFATYRVLPFGTVHLIAQEGETLILDFGGYWGESPFGSDGLVSAKFQDWESLPLRPGLEVAQVDWNGVQAHIDWVTIDEIRLEEGIPTLVLANFVSRGASGGGVFWNGTHIANTWFRVTATDKQSQKIVRRYTAAALNSPHVVALLP